MSQIAFFVILQTSFALFFCSEHKSTAAKLINAESQTITLGHRNIFEL
jgi:hypothetical protein